MSSTVKNCRVIKRLLCKLPEHYQNFYIQWKLANPDAFRHIPRPKCVQNPEPGRIKCAQTRQVAIRQKFTRPPPIYYLPPRVKGNSEPIEIKRVYVSKPYLETISKEYGLWGGEGIINSSLQKNFLRRFVPPFLSPAINKTVVYSEILDKHLEIKVSRNTQFLIDYAYGFDGYILETSPQELQSLFGVKLRRELLLALVKKDFLPNDPAKREELYKMFISYIIPLEEAEWYGLTLREAVEKFQAMQKMRLKNSKLNNMNEKKESEKYPSKSSTTVTWVSKLNPFRPKKSV